MSINAKIRSMFDAPFPQPVLAPLTSAAIFLVACIKPDNESYATVRSLCADLPGIFRAVDFRRIEGGLSCVAAFGSDAWDKLFGKPRPPELHSFREIRSGERHAVSTPADVLFHIRAKRMDLCFEMVAQIMARIGAAVAVEDPQFGAGSYVIIQKYLHDMSAWNRLSVEEQELVLGRKKLSDIELSDTVKPSSAHNALTTIVENGKEVKILRDNMPFGKPGHGEFGTYFIGYSRSPRTIEQMLENMFIGRPPGNYDRLLDFSRPVTGSLFFAPSATFLENLDDQGSPAPPASGSLTAEPG